MKILHLPVAYLPWTVGGREIYTHTLSRSLKEIGIESAVAIHQNPATMEPLGLHEHECIPVHVLPQLPGFFERETAYSKVYPSLPGFGPLLDQLKPDLVHFHDQGAGASLSHMREVKRRGIPALLTYHTPGQTCPQRELLRHGRIPCDGEVRLQRCTACRLAASGLPQMAAQLAALAEWPGIKASSSSRWQRVLSARTMTRLFHESLTEFFNLADGIVAYAKWSLEVLRLNGASEDKLHFIRTAGRALWQGERGPKYPERQPLKLVFLGRCTPVKGLHVLVEAVKQLPADAPVEVHFLGPYWDEPYGIDLQNRIRGDTRFMPPRLVPNADLMPVLAEMDIVVIPSLWLETGPLTVFDAFAAGVPIIGSRLGGIAELVKDGETGWLFEAGNVRELKELLARLLSGAIKPLDGGRMHATPPRTMAEVAADHSDVYHRLISNRAPA